MDMPGRMQTLCLFQNQRAIIEMSKFSKYIFDLYLYVWLGIVISLKKILLEILYFLGSLYPLQKYKMNLHISSLYI